MKDLHDWHVRKCSSHPLLVGCTTREMEEDPCVELMRTVTEEGKKVEREGRFGYDKYYMVYKRADDGEVGAAGKSVVTAENFFEEGQFGVEIFENEKKG